jgi:integrase
MRERPYQANRTLSLLRMIFAKGIAWGMVEANPAKGDIKRFEEHPRQRYLDGDEIARLMAALDQHPRRSSALAIKLLLLTGARRSEVLGAKWSEFDLAAGLWRPPGSGMTTVLCARAGVAMARAAAMIGIDGCMLGRIAQGRGSPGHWGQGRGVAFLPQILPRRPDAEWLTS